MQLAQRQNVKAALLMMLGMTLLSSNDVIIKLGSENLGIGQLLFIRGMLAVAIFSIVIKVAGKPVIPDADVEGLSTAMTNVLRRFVSAEWIANRMGESVD